MTTETAAAVVDTTKADAAADAGADQQGELKKLIAQRDELKRKLREIEPLAAKAKEFEQAQMTEQQKLVARVAELEPKAGRAERYETVIGALLESELATVPEDMRDLVPAALAPEEKLDWLRQAKGKGLFKPVEPTPTHRPEPTDSPITRRAGGSPKVIKRASFDKLSGYAQAEHIRSGGVVED